MRRDTLLSPGRLALPSLSLPPFTFPPGARPMAYHIRHIHIRGCGGWLGLVLYGGSGGERACAATEAVVERKGGSVENKILRLDSLERACLALLNLYASVIP
eukprot:scaffold8867_cov118-Isochrysis_galbana.AAC.12